MKFPQENIMSEKRVAFVAGGIGGLGSAIGRRLHARGMTVAISHSPRNDHIVGWLMRERDAGRMFYAYEADVAEFDSCAYCAELVVHDHGRVDVLVNNAGITRDATFATMKKADWDAVLRTDLDALFNMTKPVVCAMVERGF